MFQKLGVIEGFEVEKKKNFIFERKKGIKIIVFFLNIPEKVAFCGKKIVL